MSLETLEAVITAKRNQFALLNQSRNDPTNSYLILSAKIEHTLGELADEIARLQMAKNFIGATNVLKGVGRA